MWTECRVALALVLCGMLVSGAAAQVNVGDKPQLAFRDFSSGKPVSLEQMRGKIVVVDFWATWCGPCVAQAPHMVQIARDYGPKGLVMVGVSLDTNGQKLEQMSQQLGFNWPQSFDGGGNKAISAAWGVRSIPATFILGPDGTVLWKGHPARMDMPLMEAFAKHPPELVDAKTLAAANTALDEIEKAINEGSELVAIRQLAAIPAEARLNKAFSDRAEAIQGTLLAFADRALAEAEQQIQQKQFAEALARLKTLAEGFKGSAVGKTAQERYATVSADPSAKAALAEVVRHQRAAEALAAAQQLKSGGKDSEAYRRFKAIAQDFADTESAAPAAAAVAEYEADESFVKEVIERDQADQARAALSMADSYRANNRIEQARQRYQKVIEDFPGTSFAEEAQKALKAMQ